MVGTIALTNDLAVPFETECLQGTEDAVRRPGDFARPIKILEPKQPASPMRPRIEVARHRRK